jgi:aminopeptidase N
MPADTPVTTYRTQYQPYPYAIPEVELEFDLDPATTVVRNRMTIVRQVQNDATLVLDGEELELVSVMIDGQAWGPERYRLTSRTLEFSNLPAQATVEIISRCKPSLNSQLMGLYVSGGNFFTQCEAEGFRRITWFADRPDVMSRYRVTLRAAATYPVLLSNGNQRASRTLPDHRLEVVWEDPFPKPCYLFALVAGQFTHRETRVTTASGREVLLQVYSDPGSENKTEWALHSLVRALRWDENRFGLELDLDRFMVVAVRDFNMGAMENKGLNIFNAAYVLADPETATDDDYTDIESVIGHEYFHNWTGNRVTCRDWFQLSLKEGLTVFRDQEFSADMMAQDAKAAASARTVKRIDDVVTLRSAQFPEDAGPMAHPIRPDSYQEIGNFYTATVYEKGAEVIRMQQTLLGEAGFRAGLKEYFRRHDGQAVTCDDFVAAMESIYVKQHPERDLSGFRRCYAQAGTPRVRVDLHYDATTRRCTVTLAQSCPPVGIEKQAGDGYIKAPFHIPFALGMLDRQGRPMGLRYAGLVQETVLLELTTERQQWVFEDIPSPPVPSLLRDFSAPIMVEYDWSTAELALLSAHDPNPFARWEAGQELATRQILHLTTLIQANKPLTTLEPSLLEASRALLTDPELDAAYRTQTLSLPTFKTLAERMPVVDPLALVQARDDLRRQLGCQLATEWRQAFEANQTPGTYSPTPEPAGKRALKSLALHYLMAAEVAGAQDLALVLYEHATNMTDRLEGLWAIVNYGDRETASTALHRFYDQWQHDPLVIDKWFALQATARSSTVETIRDLMNHPAFTLRNPNRARALIFQFCVNNPRSFHHADGAGYALWAEQVLALDAFNPEIAARLARALENWSRFIPALRLPMQAVLQQVHAHIGLSRNVAEIVSKALEFAA